MLQIFCTLEQKQELVEWLTVQDTKCFGDVERADGGPEDGHKGVFDILDNEDGIVIDCGGDEFECSGHHMPSEIEDFIRAIKKQFPTIGMQGVLFVADPYEDAEFEIKKKPGKGRLYITLIRDEDDEYDEDE